MYLVNVSNERNQLNIISLCILINAGLVNVTVVVAGFFLFIVHRVPITVTTKCYYSFTFCCFTSCSPKTTERKRKKNSRNVSGNLRIAHCMYNRRS